MHSSVELFVEKFRKEAEKENQYRNELGGLEIAFLENVLGPVFDYDFTGVTAEYPFKDIKGKDRFADFHYSDGITRTIIELDGFTTHARDVSELEFDDHLERQNDLLLNGWFLLRFSPGMFISRPERCQSQLMQAIGKWHYVRGGTGPSQEKASWHIRKLRLIRFVARNQELVKPAEIARVFQVSNRTAGLWLKRLVKEGVLEPASGKHRITEYRLRERA